MNSLLVSIWIMLAIYVVVLTGALAGILRQLQVLRGQVADAVGTGPRTARFDELRGTHMPEFAHGNAATAVLFLDDGCPVCDLLLARLSAHVGELDGDLRIVVVHPGSASAEKLELMRSVTDNVVSDQGRSLASRYGFTFAPIAVLLDPQGRVLLAEPIGNVDAVDEFLSQGFLSDLVSQT